MNRITEILHSWWDSLTVSMLSGAEGLGVYLDRENLTLVQVQKNISGIKLVNETTIPYLQDDQEGMLLTLRETVKAWNAAASPVSLAVSPDLAFLQPGSLPGAASENLAQVVAYELDRFLPLPDAQLYYTYQILSQTETEVRLMLLAVPRHKVEPCLHLLKAADLRPVEVTLAPVAAANAFFFQTGKHLPASWLLLQVMADAFALTHLDGQAVQSFFHQRGVPRRDLGTAVQTHVAKIFETGPAPGALCVYGTPQADLVERLRQEYAFEVVHPDLLLLPESPGAGSSAASLTALGAAISCLVKPGLKANLLPLAEREPVSFKNFSLNNSLLIALLALCLIWAGSALIHKRFRLFQVNQQIAELAPEAREVENLLKEGRALAEQMSSLRTIGASPDKLVILKNLTQTIPTSTWLYSVRLSKQVLEISGTSQSASELIPLLEKSGWLKKTEFVSPIVTDANKNEQFKIKAEIKSLEPAS